jgi:hypothetical protein
MKGTQLRCLELNPQYHRSLASKTLRLSGGKLPKADSVPWERVEEFRVSENGEISRLRVR